MTWKWTRTIALSRLLREAEMCQRNIFKIPSLNDKLLYTIIVNINQVLL